MFPDLYLSCEVIYNGFKKYDEFEAASLLNYMRM